MKTKKKRTPRKKQTARKSAKKKTFASEALDAIRPSKYGALGLLTDEAKENIKKSFDQEIKIPKREIISIMELKAFNPEGKLIPPNQNLAIYDGDGNLVRITAEQVAFGMEAYKERFYNPREYDQPGSIKSMPQVKERCTFKKEYKIESFNEVFLHGKIERPNFTQFSAAIDEFLDRLNDMHNAINIQGSDGNWNVDEYMFGMYNGMDFMLSVIEGRKPKYKDRPSEGFKHDSMKNDTTNGRQKSPAEFIGEFLKECNKHPDQISVILQDTNTILLNRIREEAERTGELSAIARKRFEECMNVLQGITSKNR